MMMGISGRNVRTASATSMPEPPGMLKSVTTTSNDAASDSNAAMADDKPEELECGEKKELDHDHHHVVVVDIQHMPASAFVGPAG